MELDRHPDYPDTEELDVLIDKQEAHNHIMQFLEYLDDNHIRLCRAEKIDDWTDGYQPVPKTDVEHVYAFLGIDGKKVEQERKAVLKFMREFTPPKEDE